MTRSRPTATRGFTLTELLVVMAIIGILIGFILVAAQDGVRRAEEKATLALITKLDMGLAERIDAMLLRRADITMSHYAMAAVYASPTQWVSSPQRAQVIAQFDLFKAEVPDVFYYEQNPPIAGHIYPFNFAAVPYKGTPSYDYTQPSPAPITSPPLQSLPYGVPLGSLYGPGYTNNTIGMFGATYQAAAGLYKNLGYAPAGYDGADNNNDGYIDDLLEGIGTNDAVSDPSNPSNTIKRSQLIANRLAAHKHNTARSEMLYALLVEGSGPLGSVFNRDEFTSREVADTDGDGLPEFIDAWGQPIQFYRWPIYYNNEPFTNGSAVGTAIQKGTQHYYNLSEIRQVDPLDPNQMLVSLSWWSGAVNGSAPSPLNSYPVPNPAYVVPGGTGNYSHGASAFMTHFHSLVDPTFVANDASGHFWDRSSSMERRSYFSRYLILSGGPDKTPGPGVLNDPVTSAVPLIAVENNAFVSTPLPDTSHDDVTNFSLASPGGGVR